MRSAFRRVAALLIAGPLAGPAAAGAQSSIRGVVIDDYTSRPIRGATVRMLSAAEQVTESNGRFLFVEVSDGATVLETRHLGYVTRTDTVRLTGGDVRLEIRLRSTPIELPEVEVEGRSRKLLDAGFFARQSRGIGVFFTRDQINESGARSLSDLFSRIPGMRRAIMPDGSSRVDARGRRTLVTRCDIQYFLNGVRSDLGVGGIDVVPVQIVEGVEVYRGGSETPTQFDHGRAMCGAILIWTRGG